MGLMARATWAAVCALWVSAALVDGQNVVKALGKELTKEIAAVKQPIDETITFVGSSQCSNVKKIFGVAYDQIEGDSEPDLNLLKIDLRTNEYRTVFNISSAAAAIPQSRQVDAHNKLVIFLHGFIDNPTTGSSFNTISDAFLKKGKCNILALDANPLIRWLYLRSTTYVRFIGEKLGAVLAAMVQHGVNPADIHMIGHSLGAHISGFTGKTFHDLTGQKVGRISGLDPAGPCFSHVDPELRLKETDADFVDVIHTDSGVYGLTDPVGHVDYFPNQGLKQPNCLLQTCSHSRAWEYYAESVTNTKAFPAVKCGSWDEYKAKKCSNEISYMGYPAKSSVGGLFYLRTGDESPYGLGDKGLKYAGEDGVVNNVMAGGQDAAKSLSNFGARLLG